MLKMSSNLCQADLHTPGNDITESFGLYIVGAFLSPVTAEDILQPWGPRSSGPLFIVSP